MTTTGTPPGVAEVRGRSQVAEPRPGTGRRPLMSRRVTLAVLGLAALALLLRLAMLTKPLTLVDRLFVPDDAYYTLAIARSLAEGLGPSADGGVTLTTGFQPLIAFLIAPVFWVTDDLGVPLRALLVVLALADAVTVVLLARLAGRLAGPAAALVAAALWAVSPYALSISLNGLESALALTMTLALVEVWCLARERSGLRLWALAGALAGLALLTRVDTAFVVVLLGVLELASRRVRPVLLAAGTALLVVLPWWAYSIVLTGSPVPESGKAVQEIVSVHRGLGLGVTDSLGLAVGRVVGSPVLDLPDLRAVLDDSPARAVASAAGLCVALGAAALWAGTRRRNGIRQLPLLALGLHAVSLVLFYTFLDGAPWFYDRYLVPVAAVCGLVIAVLLGQLWSAAAARRPGGALGGVFTAAVLAVLVVPAAQTVRLLDSEPEGSVDVGYDGAKGYAEVAREVLAKLPPGAVLGSLQTGALAYFAPNAAPGRVQVVNLDGVVDGNAGDALADDRLADYLHQRGVTHFADWPLNYFVLQSHSTAAEVGQVRLEPIGKARLQGGERFEISRVSYPGAP